ncbi:unnamed protein product, partial [Allacma fusca]
KKMAAISDGKLLLQGYVYVKSKKSPDVTKTYWDCRRVRLQEGKSRAITAVRQNGELLVLSSRGGPQPAAGSTRLKN